ERLGAAAGMPAAQRVDRSAPGRGGARGGGRGTGPQGGRGYGNPAGSRGEAPALRRSSMFAPAPGTSTGKAGGRGAGGAGSQPDPMKTSLGYIGHDALQRKRAQDAERGGPPKRKRKPGGR